MGTARSASSTPAAPRKRAPRKATARTATPAAAVDTPPAPAPADPGAERLEKLRQMLADEGLDPDVVLAGTASDASTPPVVEGAVVDGAVVDGAVVDGGYPPGFEPIPGVNLDGIRKIIDDAQQNPTTAETVIGGLRSLIADNGHDPDAIIAAATGDPTGKPAPQGGIVNAVVDFQGRQIEVTAPEIEQVMVIRRMQSLFANAARMDTITADEAIRLMDRALKAVCSVVVDPDDVEYLEDLLLTRQAKIEDMLPLLRESLKALERANAGSGNRAERRKAAKSAGRAGRAALATSGE